MNPGYTVLTDIFNIPDAVYTVEHLLHGHINKTYSISQNGRPVYILQQINTEIFRNIDQLMANYSLVTNTISAFQWPTEVQLKTPEIIRTGNGALYHTDDQDNSWRLLTFIEGAECISIPRNERTSYQGGLAFGAFLMGLSGIDPDLLFTVLPDFHSLEKRYNEFLIALETNIAGRVSLTAGEIEFARSRRQRMNIIPQKMASGEIPVRVVHNDTKLTNIIFSECGKAVGIIDLDTVMAGSALFDFGDAIRSLANPACEDETNLSKVRFDIELFDAFSKGYLESAHPLLRKSETELLPECALLLTYIIGLRFLTDFLNGDVYYHTEYPEHNLVRARVQFRFLEQMESHLAEMHRIIGKNLQIPAEN
ncbi:MAG: aminoglycoside phosphotransferase family protein [Bacteroidota bacterium]